eukprot:tig00000217_g19177.t1
MSAFDDCSAAFARGCTRVVVAQICRELGFSSVHGSALEVLSEMLEKYVEETGALAHANAEAAGRTEVNFFDVRTALERVQGRYMPSDRVLEELMQMKAHFFADLQFEKGELPRFPLKRQRRADSEAAQQPVSGSSSEPMPDHVPPHLPPFPPRHTYKSTPVFDDKAPDPRAARKDRNKEQRDGEKALHHLMDRATKIKPHDFFTHHLLESVPSSAPAIKEMLRNPRPPSPPTAAVPSAAPGPSIFFPPDLTLSEPVEHAGEPPSIARIGEAAEKSGLHPLMSVSGESIVGRPRMEKAPDVTLMEKKRQKMERILQGAAEEDDDDAARLEVAIESRL